MKNYILLLFISLSVIGYINAQQKGIPIDSIYILRKLSRDNKYTRKQQLVFAQRSYELAKLTKIDSTIMWSQMRLANVNFYCTNYKKSLEQYKKSLKAAEHLNNKKKIAHITNDLGAIHFYLGQSDSAYFYSIKSIKYNDFEDSKDKHNAYQIIADIQQNFKLYLKSEQNIIKALDFLNQIPETKDTLNDKWSLYHSLGIISKKQERYQEALKYYKKAISICNRMIKKGFKVGELNLLYVYNNIAEVYQNQKDYTNALHYYKKALKSESSLKEDPSFYPLLLINMSYTKFLKGDKNVNTIISDIKQAYKMCDTLKDNQGRALSEIGATLYLANIYIKEKQIDSAHKYVNESYKLSKSIGANQYLLESLLLLSETREGDAGKIHLKEYITLSDSLQKEERNMRNMFARIEYDSNQLETDNKQLIKDKKWLYFIVSGILIITLLTYTLLILRSKNKTLKFSKAQQKANEDIYSLMLVQQQKLEEGRLQERNRVSEELHDGILSKLFGTRLGLSFLELEGNTDDLIKFNGYLEQINILEKDLRDLSHNLKTSELKSENDFNNILNSLLNEQTNLHNIQYQLTNTALVNWNIVNDKIKVNIYRIIQEVLYNSIKHANAKTISLDFNTIDNNLELTINDDGKGFNVKQARKGIGLKNIASRIKTLKGTFNLDSELNKGTTIQISIPL